MKNIKLNNSGFTHYLVLIIVVVIIGLAGAYVYVSKADNNSAKSSQLQNNNSKNTSTNSIDKLSNDASTQPTSANSNSSSSTNSNTSNSGGSSSKSNSTSSKKSTTQTPLSALTAVITNLYNGVSANVTSNTVTVPGPISNATARPIVYKVNGQTYFAYTQGSAPNFNTTPAQTAGTMAMVVATVNNPSLTPAHLDKVGNLVDSNFVLVGFSTGGN